MSRPQGVHTGSSAGNPSSLANRIDATICAYAGTTVERHFAAADLSRLREAGAGDGSALTVTFSFSQFEGRVAIDGTLDGAASVTCQRCMKAMEAPLREQFKVLIVQDEAELDQEPGGYEAMLADPVRFDLQALAEDQALLALPLVPKHEDGSCSELSALETEPAAPEGTQRPFGNLRDLMRDS